MNKKSLFKFAGLFIGLAGLSLFLIYIANRDLLTIAFYEKSDQAVSGIPDQQITIYEAIQRWIYLYAVGYLALKVLLIAGILATCLFLKDYSVSFIRLLIMITSAEYLFLIPAAIKIWWFKYVDPHADLNQWLHFYPVSLLSLFPDTRVIWIYPLQLANLFEVVYWFLLAYGIKRLTTLNYDFSLRIVLCSYFPALVAWLAVVSFFTLLFFPQAG